MRVSIRPDICLALRIIGIQEYGRRNEEFIEAAYREVVTTGRVFYQVTENFQLKILDPRDVYEDYEGNVHVKR